MACPKCGVEDIIKFRTEFSTGWVVQTSERGYYIWRDITYCPDCGMELPTKDEPDSDVIMCEDEELLERIDYACG